MLYVTVARGKYPVANFNSTSGVVIHSCNAMHYSCVHAHPVYVDGSYIIVFTRYRGELLAIVGQSSTSLCTPSTKSWVPVPVR